MHEYAILYKVMRKPVLLIMSLMLVSLTGCEFLRSVAGRPTDKDIEEKRIAILRAEEEALQQRLDSIRLIRERNIADSLAKADEMKALEALMSGPEKIGGLSGTELACRYYIMVGAFRETANARKLFNVASAKGYDPVLINSRRGMIAVGLAPTDSLSVLKETYDKLVLEPFCPKEAWILVNE